MATFTQVGDRWRAQVRRKGHKSIAQTFGSKREAEQWARRVEAALDAGAARDPSTLTVAEVVGQYRRLREELGSPVLAASNTEYMLQHLEDDLGIRPVADLTPDVMLRWARTRQTQGAGGYTVNMELSLLGTVIRHTSSFLRVILPDVVGQARPLLNYGGLISGGTRRTRRPTQDELQRLLTALEGVSPTVADAVRLSSIVGLRRSELTRIVWEDVDHEAKAVMVRRRKHPRRRLAKDEWVPLLGDAWTIVQRQPGRAGRIFPVSPEKLTDSVTETVRALGIPDLRLHDMRREATSRLRELGFDRDARKAIVGHKSDEVHSIYVAVRMEDLHQQYDEAQGAEPRPSRPPSEPAPPAAARRTRRSPGG